jgi:hypothetical protein
MELGRTIQYESIAGSAQAAAEEPHPLQLVTDGFRTVSQPLTARIVSVDGSKRSAFGRSINFGTYSLTVRYRDSDGKELTNWVSKRTYGFPSKGDSITLLIDPKDGGIEASPFPELWIVLVLVYAGMGWLMRFFIIISRAELHG